VERNKERCRPTAHEDLAPVAEVLNSHGVLAQLEHTSCAHAQSELDSGRMWAHSLLHGRSWHRLSAHTVYMKLACALTRKVDHSCTLTARTRRARSVEHSRTGEREDCKLSCAARALAMVWTCTVTQLEHTLAKLNIGPRRVLDKRVCSRCTALHRLGRKLKWTCSCRASMI
jgi:hypothetical protein